MKKHFFNLLAIVLVAIVACGCTSSTNTSNETAKPVQVKQENPVVIASPEFAKSLSDIFNKGYSIVDPTKVYYTKSADFAKVYFVGTLVQKNGQYYNAIWATNDVAYIGAGLVFSMNDFAIQSSGMGDGRTNADPLSESDDGYSRINTKVLNDMSNAINAN